MCSRASGPVLCQRQNQTRTRRLAAGPLRGRPSRSRCPLSELWGEPGARLARELTGAGSDPTGIDEALLVERIEQAFTSRLAALPPRHQARGDLVHRASQLLTGHGSTDGGPEQVSVTATRLHVSERSLRLSGGFGLPGQTVEA